MNNPSKVFFGMLIIAGVAVVAFFTIGPPAEKVYATPQEVFDAANKASAKDDARAWFQCLTDGSRDILAASGVMFMAELRKAADGKADARDIDKLFAKYRLKDDFLEKFQTKAEVLNHPQAGMEEKLQFARALLEPVRDRLGFSVDLQKVMRPHLRKSPMDLFQDAKLSAVKISGETAQGTMSVEKGGSMPLAFRKQGDGWRIDMIATDRRPQIPQDLK